MGKKQRLPRKLKKEHTKILAELRREWINMSMMQGVPFVNSEYVSLPKDYIEINSLIKF